MIAAPWGWGGRAGGWLATLAALVLTAGCEDATTGPRLPQLVCAADGTIRVDGELARVAPDGYLTVGNQIVSSRDCEPWRFIGVGYPALSFTSRGDRLGVEATAASDFALIRSWGANTVRIELAQYYWVSSSRYHDPAYAERVERAVRLAREAGLDVILALQYSDRGDANYPLDPDFANMHQPMPDANHSIPFWRDLARRFGDDGRVLFELYSEPYPLGGPGGFSNWDLWLNGGLAPADDVYEPRAAFQAAGMQELYDVVRAEGAENLVLVGGTQWGYDLSGIPANRVKGYNIVYATHPWDYVDPQSGAHARPPADFPRAWGFLAATDPVILTEFGTYDCSVDYLRSAIDLADEHGVSWIAWAWQAPGPTTSTRQEGAGDPVCDFPMLLLDWSGTPSRTGEFVKARLAAAEVPGE